LAIKILNGTIEPMNDFVLSLCFVFIGFTCIILYNFLSVILGRLVAFNFAFSRKQSKPNSSSS